MIEWREFESKALKGFAVGDSLKRKFPVYLPPKVESARSPGYPVAFILGRCGQGAS